MKEWSLKNVTYLAGGSNQSDDIGQILVAAKYKKTYLNSETGEIRSITDLQSKIFKRNQYLSQFFRKYSKCFCAKKISVLTAVVDEREYPSISKFVNTITRKLKRRGITRLGYVWVRDVGEIKFEKHFHILIATSRISSDTYHTLFHKKKHTNYDIECMKTKKGMLNYLKEKDLYGMKKQRT